MGPPLRARAIAARNAASKSSLMSVCDLSAQKVRPEEVAERSRLLGISAGTSQSSGEAAERVIGKSIDRRWDVAIVLALALGITRPAPPAPIEGSPEPHPLERSQIVDNGNLNIGNALGGERAEFMVSVENIATSAWAEHDGYSQKPDSAYDSG